MELDCGRRGCLKENISPITEELKELLRVEDELYFWTMCQ